MKKKVLMTILVIVLLFPALASANLWDGLWAYYPFNGDAQDVSGNNNHGTFNQYYQDPTSTADRFGNLPGALDFWGSEVDIPNTNFSQGTVAGWVNFRAYPAYHPYYTSWFSVSQESRDYAMFGVYTDTNLVFGLYAGGYEGWKLANSQTTLQTGKWYFLAGTWGPGGIHIYIDGVEKGSNIYTSGLSGLSNIAATCIGRAFGGVTFDGQIDDVYIFNRALSATEIGTLAAVPIPGAVWLLGTGLLGLVGLRRFKKS